MISRYTGIQHNIATSSQPSGRDSQAQPDVQADSASRITTSSRLPQRKLWLCRATIRCSMYRRFLNTYMILSSTANSGSRMNSVVGTIDRKALCSRFGSFLMRSMLPSARPTWALTQALPVGPSQSITRGLSTGCQGSPLKLSVSFASADADADTGTGSPAATALSISAIRRWASLRTASEATSMPISTPRSTPGMPVPLARAALSSARASSRRRSTSATVVAARMLATWRPSTLPSASSFSSSGVSSVGCASSSAAVPAASPGCAVTATGGSLKAKSKRSCAAKKANRLRNTNSRTGLT